MQPKMYKLMYDPTSFTPFFRPAPYAVYMDKLYTAPLYIVVWKVFVLSASGDSLLPIHPDFVQRLDLTIIQAVFLTSHSVNPQI